MISKFIKGKSAKQIQKRWIIKHDPSVLHRHWSQHEDDLIIAFFNQLGGKWIEIAKHLPERHPDAIKNRYYSVLRRRDFTRLVNPKKIPDPESVDVLQSLKDLVSQYQMAVVNLNERIKVLEKKDSKSS